MEAALAATAAPVCPRRPRCPRVTGAQGRRCNGKERTVQPWGRRLLFVPSEQGQFLSGFSVSLLLSSAHCLSSLPPPRGGSGRQAHRGASPWAGPSRRGHPSGRPLCVSQVPRAITSRLDDARHSVFTALRTRGQEGAVPNTRRTPRKVSSSVGGGGGQGGNEEPMSLAGMSQRSACAPWGLVSESACVFPGGRLAGARGSDSLDTRPLWFSLLLGLLPHNPALLRALDEPQLLPVRGQGPEARGQGPGQHWQQ